MYLIHCIVKLYVHALEDPGHKICSHSRKFFLSGYDTTCTANLYSRPTADLQQTYSRPTADFVTLSLSLLLMRNPRAA